MTPQELKTSILNLAINGQMTNKVPWKDEPNGIYKYLWEVTAWDKKFKDVEKHKQPKVIKYEYVLAKDFKKLERTDGDIYLLSTGNYAGYTTEDVAGSLVSKGEVVTMPWGGSPTIKYYKGRFVTSDNRIATAIDTQVLSNKFLYYYFLSQVKYLDSVYRGTSLRHPKMALVLEMRIPVPSIQEQELIVKKIEELLPLVNGYGNAWTKLEELNQRFPIDLQKSLLQMAIQGKLVEQRPEEGTGEELFQRIQTEKVQLIKEGKIKKEKPLPEISEKEKPFDIPESWKWVRLKEICSKIVDGDHNPPSGVNAETDYLMLSATNINHNCLCELDKVRYLTKDIFEIENERTKATEGDIFFTTVGTLGRSCVFDGQKSVCFQRSVSVLTTFVYNFYLKNVLDSSYIQNYMIANATGTAQKGFYLNQVERLVIPLPPLAEQKRIVSELEKLLPLCERLK